MLIDIRLIKQALACTCPKCGQSKIFEKALNIDVIDQCPSCGLKFDGEDSADGPAVFMIFILGFLLVPLALAMDFYFEPSLLFHTIFWGVLIVALIFLIMKPIKAYVIALQYKYRKEDLDNGR